MSKNDKRGGMLAGSLISSPEEQRISIEADNRREDSRKEHLNTIIAIRFIGFSDEVNRIRRNLLIVNMIALIYILSEANVNSLNFFGMVVENWKPHFIEQALSAFVIYHLFHFGWCFIEYWQEHKNRKNDKKEFIEFIKTCITKYEHEYIIKLEKTIRNYKKHPFTVG